METGDRQSYYAALRKPLNPSVYDDDSPTVWILDAGTLNSFACRSPDDDCVFIPGGEFTAKYLPSAIKNDKIDANKSPIVAEDKTRLAEDNRCFGFRPVS